MRGILVYAFFFLPVLTGCASNSIDLDEAKNIAQTAIDQNSPGKGYVFAPDRIIEESYGWRFVEAEGAYLDHYDARHILLGPGPLVVDRKGKVYFVPYSVSITGRIAEFVAGQTSP